VAMESEARQRALAGLTPEQIREVKEFANWRFIEGSSNPNQFRDHLARFSGGDTERFARKKLEELVWTNIETQTSIEALSAFLDEFPGGDNLLAAKLLMRELEAEREWAQRKEENKRAESEAWARVADSENIVDIERFMMAWPVGEHAAAAEARMSALRGRPTIRRAIAKAVFYIGVGFSALAVSYLFVEPIWLKWLGIGCVILVVLVIVPAAQIWRLIRDDSVRTFLGHSGAVSAVAFSPDGRAILSGSEDRMLKLWDVAAGKELRTFTEKSYRYSEVYSVAFSPDGSAVLSGGTGAKLFVHEVDTGKELRAFEGGSEYFASVTFSPDGRTALFGGSDATLKLWDLATSMILRIFTGHSASVSSVAFFPDGRRVLSSSWDGTLKLWDLATGKELRTFTDYFGPLYSVAVSPNGRTALCGGQDGTLKLWDVATGEVIRTFRGHSGLVKSVAFAPDARTGLSGGIDNTLRLWDLATGKKLRTFVGHSGSVNSVAFSPDGRAALSGSGDKTLKIWDLTPCLISASGR
jgi:hypothetical protein